MIKLLRSNLKRILSSKTFWICSATYILYGLILSIWLCQIDKIDIRSADYPISNYGLSGSPFTGIIIMLILCIIMNADFSNNAIRNKIIIGYSKEQIYASNLLAYFICVIALQFVYLCVTLPFFFGWTFNSSLWNLFGDYIGQMLLWIALYNILTVAAYVSLYTAIIMNMKNALVSTVTGVVLNLVAMFVTWYVMAGSNYAYETLNLLNFYPTGIDTLIAFGSTILYSMMTTTYVVYIVIPIIWILLTAIIGLTVFKKSAIK
ncbi:MAG: hypothetical protein K2I23_00400 [Clostridia bacterium]|nr:hypothetical protein [Clostridia bacterium]